MQIDWWTLALQAVNVLVLVWLLARFLFRPVAAMIEERRQAASKLFDEAKAAKAEAEIDRERARHDEADVAAKRAAALAAAAREADAAKAALLAKARGEADELRAAATADIARARAAGEATAFDRASQLAVDIAAKMLARLPEAVRITAFLDGLADGLAALPETGRAVIGADGEPVRLKVARGLSDAELSACRDRLAQVLGRPVTVAVEVDPALIAGIELVTPHSVVRNSLGADLERIRTELLRPESERMAAASNGSAPS